MFRFLTQLKKYFCVYSYPCFHHFKEFFQTTIFYNILNWRRNCIDLNITNFLCFSDSNNQNGPGDVEANTNSENVQDVMEDGGLAESFEEVETRPEALVASIEGKYLLQYKNYSVPNINSPFQYCPFCQSLTNFNFCSNSTMKNYSFEQFQVTKTV